jgi:hypothetical protein
MVRIWAASAQATARAAQATAAIVIHRAGPLTVGLVAPNTPEPAEQRADDGHGADHPVGGRVHAFEGFGWSQLAGQVHPDPVLVGDRAHRPLRHRVLLHGLLRRGRWPRPAMSEVMGGMSRRR